MRPGLPRLFSCRLGIRHRQGGWGFHSRQESNRDRGHGCTRLLGSLLPVVQHQAGVQAERQEQKPGQPQVDLVTFQYHVLLDFAGRYGTRSVPVRNSNPALAIFFKRIKVDIFFILFQFPIPARGIKIDEILSAIALQEKISLRDCLGYWPSEEIPVPFKSICLKQPPIRVYHTHKQNDR
jgi:hypothetical protein